MAGAANVVALTGAGISAESGIATFRDAGGLWERFDPEAIASAGGWMSFLISRPWEGAELLRGLRDTFVGAQPNAAHKALATLEAAGRLQAVVTQNVDGLHHRAGSRAVVELHGSFGRRRCTGCGVRADVSSEEVVADLDSAIGKLRSFLVSHPAHILPRCACGGLLRADVVFFGEDVHDLPRAVELVRGADILLVVGTSGMVYPAAGLPEEAKRHGACIVEVNPERTELTHLADVRIPAPAGEALPVLAAAIGCAQPA
jgi:NAD-dependent deacetylase